MPVAEQDDLVAAPHAAAAGPEVEGHVVHAHRPHEGEAAAADDAVGVVGQPAPPPVPVPDRDGGEHRVARGDEPAPVAGALARPGSGLTSAT